MREVLREEQDAIAAAQRALRVAEKQHDREIEFAERRLRAARTAAPIAGYGHHVALYADRVSTTDGDHELTPDVRAWLEDRVLTIEGPTWRHEVPVHRRDEARVRRLAEDIELAARNVDATRGDARAEAEQANQDLGEAHIDRRAVQETRVLIGKLGGLVEEDEEVLDMAPGINTGHDGVLVATDRRLLFVSVRRTVSYPYAQITSVVLKGKRFGTRMALSTPTGRGVVSGLAPRHASELADLVRGRIAG